MTYTPDPYARPMKPVEPDATFMCPGCRSGFVGNPLKDPSWSCDTEGCVTQLWPKLSRPAADSRGQQVGRPESRLGEGRTQGNHVDWPTAIAWAALIALGAASAAGFIGLSWFVAVRGGLV